jgi:hypothetical protein
MTQQAKISYSVGVENIPADCADLMRKVWDQIQPYSALNNVEVALLDVDSDNFDLREALIKLEKFRGALALVDQRAVEVTNILVGLQKALVPQPTEDDVSPEGGLVPSQEAEEG